MHTCTNLVQVPHACMLNDSNRIPHWYLLVSVIVLVSFGCIRVRRGSAPLLLGSGRGGALAPCRASNNLSFQTPRRCVYSTRLHPSER